MAKFFNGSFLDEALFNRVKSRALLHLATEFGENRLNAVTTAEGWKARRAQIHVSKKPADPERYTASQDRL